MKKVNFNLVRTVELQSWQEFKLTDEQAKEFEELEDDTDKTMYLTNLNKLNYDSECEDDTLEIRIENLKIRKIRIKND